MSLDNKKKSRSLTVIFIETFIVFIITSILTSMATPNFPAPRASIRQKACYSNIRILYGAIEMYNLDHKDTFNELNDKTLSYLYDEKYLKGNMNLPTPRCNYRSIYCDYHGDIGNKKPDNMDDNFESELRLKAQTQKALALITPALILSSLFFLQAIIFN